MSRYQLESPFYVSDNSLVGRCFDNLLSRFAAYKTSAPTGDSRIFQHELRIMAQLSHPHILAVWDVFEHPEYQTVSVLPFIPNVLTLEQFIQRLIHLQTATSLSDLLRIFLQICKAIEYAHTLGIIHCDIKPSNILQHASKHYYVTDWDAAAKVRLNANNQPPQYVLLPPSGVRYTPEFAAPEVLGGASPVTSTDIYGLGALLHFLLTGRAPFPMLDGETLEHYKHRRFSQPIERILGRENWVEIPQPIEQLCLAALRDASEDRPLSVDGISMEVKRYLEQIEVDAVLSANRRAKAQQHLLKADMSDRKWKAIDQQRMALKEQLNNMHANVLFQLSAQARDTIWKQEDNLHAIEQQLEEAFAETFFHLQSTLEHEPEMKEARDKLIDLLIWRYKNFDSRGATEPLPGLEALIRSHAGPRKLFLDEPTHVEIDGPEKSAVFLATMIEDTRVLTPMNEELVGHPPLTLKLKRGRWRVRIQRPGYADAIFPLKVGPAEHRQITAALPKCNRILPGFAYIPAGTAHLGGDKEGYEQDLRLVDLPAFVIAIHPITCGEYLDYLNDIALQSPEDALQRSPRRPGIGPRWQPNPAGLFELTDEEKAVDYDVLKTPVTLVNAFDAEAFCAWRTLKERVQMRLPTSNEWEKAARGDDRRFFPWGDCDEPTFSNNRASKTKQSPFLEPIGSRPTDCSPYSVMEMAGHAAEWTGGSDFGSRQVRGGAWFVEGRQCRAARQVKSDENKEYPSVGFRLCYSLS